MCGIGGIYNPDGFSPQTVIKMSETIRHRGPDDEGYSFVDFKNVFTPLRGKNTIKEMEYLKPVNEVEGEIKLALLHRRLSIIDLKPSGHQPMSSMQNDLTIVFNGEIYNYIELRDELKKSGYSFKSESDTEVILASYQHWSEKCVDHFLGMWAFVILDIRRNILFCSRDRFGIKPFYFIHEGTKFAFSSEIKALLVIPGITPELETKNAIEFLTNGNQYFFDKTFFRGINQLPPGHNLIYSLNEHRLSLHSFYNLYASDNFNSIGLEEAIQEFHRLVADSIKIHLRADVPIGTCLSGGLDSSTIVAMLSDQNLPYKLNTFSASFPGDSVDETYFIKKLKPLYNFSDHYTYPDPQKLWKEIDLLLWHQDVPVQSTSLFAQWEVMSLAQKASVKVLLDGQGMDEILGGYSEFIGAYLLGQISRIQIIKVIKSLRYLKSNYKTTPVYNELSRALFYLFPQSFRSYIYSTRRLGPSIIGEKYKDVSKKIIFKTRITNSIRETSIYSIRNILPVLLRYEDRNSMAFSIESRVPFLDHRLVEFCVNLPDDFKIHNGWTKYVLRKSSEKYLPYEITWRKEKLGFITPEKIWMEALSEELKLLIKRHEIPDIIDKKELLKVMNNRISNKINLGEIWKIILFIKWIKVFNIKID